MPSSVRSDGEDMGRVVDVFASNGKQAGFLDELAMQCFGQRLAILHFAARERPSRIATIPDGQHPAGRLFDETHGRRAIEGGDLGRRPLSARPARESSAVAIDVRHAHGAAARTQIDDARDVAGIGHVFGHAATAAK